MSHRFSRTPAYLLLAALTASPVWAQPEKPNVSVAESQSRSHASRYLFVGGGVGLLTGLGFAYWAQGESKRAETVSSATEASRALENARASAATANLLYALAGLTVVYGLLLELLPAPAAEKASLTFHF